MSRTPPAASFRARLLARDHLVGTFIKTPTTHAIEILGAVGFDFMVIDAEHAPFDRAAIDVCLLAARAAGTAGLVRVGDVSQVLSALDCGASGVLVPHVTSAEATRQALAAALYRGGRRGYSGSPRAAQYGAGGMWDSIDTGDAATTVIAMIEDPEGVSQIDAIVAFEALDAVFIGRGDLTVALGAASSSDAVVRDAVSRVIGAARRVGKPVCVMVGGASEAEAFRRQGATAFIVSSDQGFMRRAGAQALASIAGLASVQAEPLPPEAVAEGVAPPEGHVHV